MSDGREIGSGTASSGGAGETVVTGTNANCTLRTGCAQQQMQLFPSAAGGACLSCELMTEQSEHSKSHVSISTPVNNTRKIAVKRNAFAQKPIPKDTCSAVETIGRVT